MKEDRLDECKKLLSYQVDRAAPNLSTSSWELIILLAGWDKGEETDEDRRVGTA
jgi:hypothetical protein